MAQQAGLDLAAITGSGPQGRIVKADIEAALSGGRGTPAAARPMLQPQPAPAAAPAAAPALSKERVLALAGNPAYTERPLTAMRRVIARRLTESKQTVPHFYLTVECEIDELLKFRAELNAEIRRLPDLGQRLRDPRRRRWRCGRCRRPTRRGATRRSSSGSAVDIADGRRARGRADHADRPQRRPQGTGDRSPTETKDLAARARAGKLKLEEFQGGTFSISNLGMFGIRISPP